MRRLVQKQTRTSGGQNKMADASKASRRWVQKQTRTSGGQNISCFDLSGFDQVQKQTRTSGGQNAIMSSGSIMVPSFRSRPELQGVKTRRPHRCRRRLHCSEADPNFRGSKRGLRLANNARLIVQKQTRTSGGQNDDKVKVFLGEHRSEADPNFRGSKPDGHAANRPDVGAFRSRPELQGVKTQSR